MMKRLTRLLLGVVLFVGCWAIAGCGGETAKPGKSPSKQSGNGSGKTSGSPGKSPAAAPSEGSAP